MSPDLNRVYDRILYLIDDDCEEIIKLVLCWVAVTRRPLTIDELVMVLALGTGKWKKNTLPPEEFLDELRDCFHCCESLVCFDAQSNTVNLVYQSAKEYLLSTYLQKMDGLSQYHIVLDRANLSLFKTCWMYLSLEEFEQGTIIIQRDEDQALEYTPIEEEFLYGHCFLRYARRAWEEHALAADPALATDHGFWKDNLNKMPTIRDYWLLKSAKEGQQLVVQQLLEKGAEPNSQDGCGRTPLSWAAERGHASIVKLLLSQDDIEADSRDCSGITPLFYAAESGQELLVRLLLGRDDVKVDSRNRYDRTPLSHAARHGHEAVVKLL